MSLCFKFKLGNEEERRKKDKPSLSKQQSLSYIKKLITVHVLLEELPTTGDGWSEPQKVGGIA